MDKDFKRLLTKYKNLNPKAAKGIDPDLHTTNKFMEEKFAIVMTNEEDSQEINKPK